MRRKKACLVVDLRDGENIHKLPEMVSVLAAAGWKLDLVLKEFGGESLKLAEQAAKKGYDTVIAFGGDGTLNQVVNGVTNVGGKSVVAVLPGGTANEWVNEIEEPLDAVHAALALISSAVHPVDLGYVGVKGLVFSTPEQDHASQPPHGQEEGKRASKKARKGHEKKAMGSKHRFLLMAGLGLDSSIIAHVSKSLKYRVGRLAYAVSTLKEFSGLHPFPLELREVADDGSERLLWQGEAWQIIFGNTRLYAGVAEVTPDAYIDDGKLDVSVIAAGNMMHKLEEVVSLLVQHKSASADTHSFRGAHFSVRVPASIGLHLDGSVVELNDYLSPSEKEALAKADPAREPLVEYRFHAEPAALPMTIPSSYSGALFSHWTPQPRAAGQPQNGSAIQGRGAALELIETLTQRGQKVTVTGVGPAAEKPDTFVIAGTTHNPTTGDTSPVGVRINKKSTVVQRNGQPLPTTAVLDVQEGADIFVDGKKGKNGCIRARWVVL